MKKRNATYLAGRWVMVLVAGIVVLLLISVSYAFYNEREYARPETDSDVAVREESELVANTYQKDSDGDGLADWEELLWDLDPHNPDTDGDGVGDKEDVFKEQRVAVSETEDDTVGLTSPSESGDPELADATETIAHELFGSYMYNLKESNITLTKEKEQEIIKGAIESVSPVLEPPLYTLDDVHTVPATQENRVVYIEAVLRNLKNMVDGVTSEHEAIYRIGQGEVEWAEQELTKTIKNYNKYIENLKNVAVPSDALTIHKEMVQALLYYTYTLEGFAALSEDPLRAAASARVFVEVKYKLEKSYVAMRGYIDMHQPTAITTNEEAI